MPKDKFRVRFAYRGWTVEHSKFGVIWDECGGFTYQSKADAQKICASLMNGVAPNSWYDDKNKEVSDA